MADYSISKRDDATDYMAEYEGFGEMRSYTEPPSEPSRSPSPGGRCRPDTGGRGSYGHGI